MRPRARTAITGFAIKAALPVPRTICEGDGSGCGLGLGFGDGIGVGVGVGVGVGEGRSAG